MQWTRPLRWGVYRRILVSYYCIVHGPAMSLQDQELTYIRPATGGADDQGGLFTLSHIRPCMSLVAASPPSPAAACRQRRCVADYGIALEPRDMYLWRAPGIVCYPGPTA